MRLPLETRDSIGSTVYQPQPSTLEAEGVCSGDEGQRGLVIVLPPWESIHLVAGGIERDREKRERERREKRRKAVGDALGSATPNDPKNKCWFVSSEVAHRENVSEGKSGQKRSNQINKKRKSTERNKREKSGQKKPCNLQRDKDQRRGGVFVMGGGAYSMRYLPNRRIELDLRDTDRTRWIAERERESLKPGTGARLRKQSAEEMRERRWMEKDDEVRFTVWLHHCYQCYFSTKFSKCRNVVDLCEVSPGLSGAAGVAQCPRSSSSS
ncbi:hypothetical protein Q8A73_010444 [Channa argus]|nr:hypothetical protein Q8A73_010444 [Channa argus]